MYKDKDQQKSYFKDYYTRNKDKFRLYHQKCDKQKLKEIKKRYRQSEKGKETLSKYYKQQRQKLRLNVIKILGGKCANPFNLPHPDWCNEPRCLQIDHINGGGTQENHNISTYGIYKKIIQGKIYEYQLLCANCNWIKKTENDEVIHKLRRIIEFVDSNLTLST